MLFRRLSPQRTIFIVVFVASIIVGTHHVLRVPQDNVDASPNLSKSGDEHSWKMPIDWPHIGSFWEKGDSESTPASCPPVIHEPLPPATVEKVIPPPPSKFAFSVRGEADPLKPTKLVKYAPGWTIFDDVYVSNGTIFIVTDNPGEWPPIRMMTSTGGRAENTPDNIASREPTDRDMQIISVKEAERMWGKRIWPVKGVSFLVNDPGQFVSHYYHFVAETWMGLWRFYSSLDSTIDMYGDTSIEMPSRVIWPHCAETEWRDYSKFNQYFMHAVFPSISMESQLDWIGRARMTGGTKAFRFERIVMSDRSATFRGEITPARNHRIVSEAWNATQKESSKFWWEPVRRSVVRFAGVDEKTMDTNILWAKEWAGTSNGDEVPTPKQVEVAKSAARRMPVVITYVVRSGHRRVLRTEDHKVLVAELTKLCDAKKWELNIVQAERLSNDEQIQIAARTTVMLGVHGNGLTHLVWMPLTPVSTVIEIFYPGGFAKDYEWTSRMLGMRHYGIWNDTAFTHPKDPEVILPEGFHGDQIPAHGPTIAQLIEDRVEGRLP